MQNAEEHSIIFNFIKLYLSVLEKHCVLLDLCCNVNKTVCMVFNPKDKSKVVYNNFPCFSVDGKPMQFVTEFKYFRSCYYLFVV